MNDRTPTQPMQTPHRGEEPDESYVLVPAPDQPGGVVALFADGSFTAWIPGDADPAALDWAA